MKIIITGARGMVGKGVLHPVIKFLLPKYTTTTKQIALAMIEVTENGFEGQIRRGRHHSV